MNKHYEANKLRSNRKAYRHIFLYAALLSTVAVIGATKVYADDTKDSEAKSELVATAPETNQLDQVSQDQTVQATRFKQTKPRKLLKKRYKIKKAQLLQRRLWMK